NLPDRFELMDGRTLAGVLLRRDDQGFHIAQKSRVRVIPVKNIRKVEGPRVAYPDYITRLRLTFRKKPVKPEATLQLASWCREHGLLRDERIHLLRSLLLDPGNRAAHEALGHRFLGGRWRVPTAQGGLVPWAEMLQRRRSFASPWKVTTSHFSVQAAGDLGEVLDLASSLEILYEAFFEMFQSKTGFYEVREPISILVYPGEKDFPRQSGTFQVYFDPGTREVRSYFQDGRAVSIEHEVTHALLHVTVREFERDEPMVPGWLNEGLANYMAVAMAGNPEAPHFEPGRRSPVYFQVQASHPHPDSLIRVLTYKSGEFTSTTNSDLKYAQSYTLVYYLLHSGDSGLREGFFRFLRSVYSRQGSMSHFKKALGTRNLDLLETRWAAYVRKIANRD
ncbi:MAG: DUF1570 domain-containing protein, partial [Planctomycetota bacterium]